MYIQSSRHDPWDKLPLSVPSDYGGSAFARPDAGAAPEEPPAAYALPQPKEDPPTAGEAPPLGEGNALPTGGEESDDETKEATPVFGKAPQDGGRDLPDRGEDAGRGGFFARFPFLSSLLPPPRGKKGESAPFPEWLVIAAVLVLLTRDEGGEDVLPFLLLLLLWE